MEQTQAQEKQRSMSVDGINVKISLLWKRVWTASIVLALVFWPLLASHNREPVAIELDDNSITVGQSCTIFTATMGDTVLFGNNEDYRLPPDSSFISFVPPQEITKTIDLPILNTTISVYGQVLVGSIIDGLFYVQGGMNDQGLCYDANSIPPEDLDQQEGGLWRPLSGCWDLLWICSTVDEVVDWYQSYRLPAEMSWTGQFHYADATGDAVIVTATGGEITFVEKGDENYLVSTNFNRANVSSHYFDYPCWRYDTACDMLDEIDSEEDLTVDACSDVLDVVHFETDLFNDIQTLYSTIYDLVNTKVHLYFLHDFENVVTFDLEEEYAKVDPNSTNYSLQYLLADESYLMKDFFPESSDTGMDYLGYGLGFGIPAGIIVVFVVIWYKRWTRNKS